MITGPPDSYIEREEPSGPPDPESNPICECGSECMEGESGLVDGEWRCVNCIDSLAAATPRTQNLATPKGQATLSLENQK